ncbi:MAG: signal recognition particle-docking protein FtsY [Candidatus Korarchaeota archaeon]|nr:signal recognition particle-docking protein FtsY [Candidatus Korarchaeota archaeon]
MLGRLVDELTARGLVKKKWTRKDILKVFDSIELELVAQGVPPALIDRLRESVSKKLDGMETKGDPKRVVRRVLKEAITEALPPTLSIKDLDIEEKPYKVIFFGFNGVGKSLSIVKMAKHLQNRGFRVLVVSADTYRAAAGDQLEGYCRKAGVPMFKGPRGADPAAVAYDGMNTAASKGYEFVLIDTAGRNYLNRNLTEELRKVVRIVKPHLKVLVIDGLAGNDVLNQCDSFEEAVGIDVIVVTKVDGSGLATPLVASLHSGKPILFLGTGQRFEDIEAFDPEKAIDYILS